MRICSFVPGATEIIAALDLADALVGRSHECDYPAEITSAPILTRSVLNTAAPSSADVDREVRAEVSAGRPLYVIDEARLRDAAPDLIVTQALCNVCGITPAQLEHVVPTLPTSPQILSMSPSCLDELLRDIERLGSVTGATAPASALVNELKSRSRAVQSRARTNYARCRVVCLEWLDPFYVAGHWVPEMIGLAGGQDVLGQPGAPSRRVGWNEIAESRPDLLLLMPCGFSLARTVAECRQPARSWPWEQLPAAYTGRVFALDANAYFSRPGPRLVRGLELLGILCADPATGSPMPDDIQRIPLIDMGVAR